MRKILSFIPSLLREMRRRRAIARGETVTLDGTPVSRLKSGMKVAWKEYGKDRRGVISEYGHTLVVIEDSFHYFPLADKVKDIRIIEK